MTAGLADSKAEWRSGIEVFDSKSLSIADLEIAETGGDGILLDGCTGCTVRKVNWKKEHFLLSFLKRFYKKNHSSFRLSQTALTATDCPSSAPSTC